MKKILTCMVILVIFPFYLFSQTPETIGKVIDKTKFQIDTSMPNSTTEKYWEPRQNYGEIKLGNEWKELTIITDNNDIIKAVIYTGVIIKISGLQGLGRAIMHIDDYFYLKGCREIKKGKFDSNVSSLLKGKSISMYEIPNSNIIGLFSTDSPWILMFVSKSNMSGKFNIEKTELIEKNPFFND